MKNLTILGSTGSPRRADEPQALSAEWDSHTAEGAALFRPTGLPLAALAMLLQKLG